MERGIAHRVVDNPALLWEVSDEVQNGLQRASLPTQSYQENGAGALESPEYPKNGHFTRLPFTSIIDHIQSRLQSEAHPRFVKGARSVIQSSLEPLSSFAAPQKKAEDAIPYLVSEVKKHRKDKGSRKGKRKGDSYAVYHINEEGQSYIDRLVRITRIDSIRNRADYDAITAQLSLLRREMIEESYQKYVTKVITQSTYAMHKTWINRAIEAVNKVGLRRLAICEKRAALEARQPKKRGKIQQNLQRAVTALGMASISLAGINSAESYIDERVEAHKIALADAPYTFDSPNISAALNEEIVQSKPVDDVVPVNQEMTIVDPESHNDGLEHIDYRTEGEVEYYMEALQAALTRIDKNGIVHNLQFMLSTENDPDSDVLPPGISSRVLTNEGPAFNAIHGYNWGNRENAYHVVELVRTDKDNDGKWEIDLKRLLGKSTWKRKDNVTENYRTVLSFVTDTYKANGEEISTNDILTRLDVQQLMLQYTGIEIYQVCFSFYPLDYHIKERAGKPKSYLLWVDVRTDQPHISDNDRVRLQ